VVDEEAIGAKFRMLAGQLDERGLRLWAAAEAESDGGGRHRGGGAGDRDGGVYDPSRPRRACVGLVAGSGPGAPGGAGASR